MNHTLTPKQSTTAQRKIRKQVITERLIALTESLIEPRTAQVRRSRWAQEAAADWRTPECSEALVSHLALVATARALHLSPEDAAQAFCLWTLSTLPGTVMTDSETHEAVTEATATELQLRAGRLLPRAERLLLRLVTASATSTMSGHVVVIGVRRKKARPPHWKKRKLHEFRG